MEEPIQCRRLLTGAISLVLLLSCLNCQAIKRRRIKPPEGVETKSYAVRLRGYEQTVTIKAPPAKVLAYIANPANVSISGLKITEATTPPGEGEPIAVGGYSPFVIRRLGLTIKGRIIVVKSEEDHFWLALDTPIGFHVERWEFKPARGETRLTFKMEYELPEKGALAKLGKLSEMAGLPEEGEKAMDLVLAGVQAHFDPNLDPEQLVASGLRGEGYETMVQVNEAQVWVNAPPARVKAWLTVAENIDRLFSNLIIFDQPVYQEFERASPGEVVYSPGVLKAGRIHSKIDLCLVKQEEDSELFARMFGVTLGYVGALEFYMTPQGGGSLVRTRFISEIPQAIPSETMELFSFVVGIPQLLPGRLMIIKQGVENQGQTCLPPGEGSR